MTDFQKGIISLINSGLTKRKVDISADFDWESAYKLSFEHSIAPLIYHGILNSELTVPNELFSQFETSMYKELLFNSQQVYEFDAVCKAFDENKIKYMPLKGSVLKEIYPEREMRHMGDVDILINLEQYNEISKILLSLGFREYKETDHELIWIKDDTFCLELHKMLVSEANRDFYKYFGDGWRLARPTDTGRFVMSDEDMFIYLFMHYAKHFRCGGIGIKHLIDFYILSKVKTELDREYILKGLAELKLDKFFENTEKTLSVWFNGAEGDEKTDFITQTIFDNGAFGTTEKAVIGNAIKTSASVKSSFWFKVRRWISLVFPSYDNMKKKYSVLGKCPLLLPIMWAVRLVKVLFLQRGDIKKQHNKMSVITDESLNDYKAKLDYVGLGFNYEE